MRLDSPLTSWAGIGKMVADDDDGGMEHLDKGVGFQLTIDCLRYEYRK